METQDLITIRSIEPSDIPFLLSSLFKSLSKYDESLFKGWTYQSKMRHINNLLAHVLNSGYYSIFIASLTQDTDIILSYIIANPKTNHVFFQYTKYNYRNLGIQKNYLMPLVLDFEKPIYVNFHTKEMLKLAKVSRVHIRDLIRENVMTQEDLNRDPITMFSGS